MKVTVVLLAAVLAFTASGAPLERNARRATTADLAGSHPHLEARSYEYYAAAKMSERAVYTDIHKRQDSAGLKSIVSKYLKDHQTPQIIIDLIQTAPDDVLGKIMALPPDKLQAVVEQLRAGHIPNIEGITPKQLVVSFLQNLGLPAQTMGMISDAPDTLFNSITKLPLDQLAGVIEQLKHGVIPNIPGVYQAPAQPGLGVQNAMAQVPGAMPDAPTATSAPAVAAPAATEAPTAGSAEESGEQSSDGPIFGQEAPAALARRQSEQASTPPASNPAPPSSGSRPQFPANGAALKADILETMKAQGAPADLQTFVSGVSGDVFDKLRDLESKVGGDAGKPFNKDIASQLDNAYRQLFSGKKPTF
ncbi:hypothetical protein AA313_de0205496 [Arthrobotrys entomopaga]|nr:hypothetical protein AA313_de0205496 [Arthrobotrys entomopaga]